MGEIVGVVRVPFSGVLCMSGEWRNAFSFPEPSRDDWRLMDGLRGSVELAGAAGSSRALPQDGIVADRSRCFRSARSLSFYGWMHDRMVAEAQAFAQEGVRNLLLDFSVDEWVDDPALYWVARSLAEQFRDACGEEIKVGIRMDDDQWASDIGARLGYDAVVCVDSCGYCDVARTRNRLCDGTGRRKPRLFMFAFSESQLERDYLVSQHPEGLVVKSRDEDSLDRLGETLRALAAEFGTEMPVIGEWKEEVVRGEMHFDLSALGARDYVLIDREARANGCVFGAVAGERLASSCEKVRKLA